MYIYSDRVSVDLIMEVEKPRVAADKMSAKEHQPGDARVASGVPCFDCSICLEPVAEPVVTLCGHLYCWPCMYRWLKSKQHGSGRCPVCKASVSEDHLVPLFGRGRAVDAARCKGGVRIPSRPPVPNAEHRRHLQDRDDDGVDLDIQPMPRFGGNYSDMDYHRAWAPVFHSNAECLLGGIALAVLPWATRRLPAPPPPLHQNGVYGGDWRMARRQGRAASRLQQIWLFLAMVALVCFLLL